MAATNKRLAQSNKSGMGAPATNRRKSMKRDGWKMTYITSEYLEDLDDTIEDEIQDDGYARAAAREASAMLLELLVAHHRDRAPRS